MTLHALFVDLKSYYPSPPYQVGLLIAAAKLQPEVSANVRFGIREAPRDEPAEDIVRDVLKAKPDLISISCYAWNHKKLCAVLRGLEHSGVALPPILIGGPNSVGEFGEAMMRDYPCITAMVEGEGEPAFQDICNALVDSPGNDLFQNSRNCVVRTASGEITRPNLGHRVQLLDDIPSPYLTGIIAAKPSPIFYETNRGCPYRCAFCYWGNGNAKIYRMSLERVRAEMEFFAEQRVSSFWLCDANFGILKDDVEIAEMMCEINARHNYPFRHVGVNWAKNSSDKVLELAATFRRGRMACTTTLALQSVTAEAEKQSQRYSMPSSRFTGLIRAANARDLDTYTDLIWGLPGESYDEFMDGVDAVISTGVPSILIHQLYLLPGTAFYEKREPMGLEMLTSPPEDLSHLDTGGIHWNRSDYWDYTITRHPKMSRDDQIRGARMQGINHLLHNHALGVVPNFFLARHGISHRQVYELFDQMLNGDLPGLELEIPELLDRFRAVILGFSDNIGLDEYLFYRTISELTWFRQAGDGKRTRADGEIRTLMRSFYSALQTHLGVCASDWESQLLSELVDYGLLLAPKPGWHSKHTYEFSFDVAKIWSDIGAQIVKEEEPEPVGVDGAAGHRRSKTRAAPGEWQQVAKRTRERLAALLSDEYLLDQRRPVSFKARNLWVAPPSKDNCDWLLSSRSKRVQLLSAA